MRATAQCLLVLMALAGAIGCDHSQPPPGQPSPSPGPSPTLQSVRIDGNPALNRPGDTSQLTATATFSDGAAKDVTADANWGSTTAVLTVSKGLVTAVAMGSSVVNANYQGKVGSVRATVKPDGACFIAGQVINAGAPLYQARVEATSASGTFAAMTDSAGRFVLAGAGDVTLRTSKFGYDDDVSQMTVDSDAQVTVALQFSGQAAGLVGPYTVTFTASPSCTLPSDATPRQYRAVVTRGAEGRLVVHLSGAQMIAWGGEAGFTGVVDGNTVRFQVSGDDFADYSFIEFLPGYRWLHYSGTATGTANGDRTVATFSATFNGMVRVVAYPAEVTVAQCQASDHRMEFVR